LHSGGIQNDAHKPGREASITPELMQILVGRKKRVLYGVFRVVQISQLPVSPAVKLWQFVAYKMLEFCDARVRNFASECLESCRGRRHCEFLILR
jgi:hypothetical protein